MKEAVDKNESLTNQSQKKSEADVKYDISDNSYDNKKMTSSLSGSGNIKRGGKPHLRLDNSICGK